MEVEMFDHHADDGMNGAESASASNAGRAVYNDGCAVINVTYELDKS